MSDHDKLHADAKSIALGFQEQLQVQDFVAFILKQGPEVDVVTIAALGLVYAGLGIAMVAPSAKVFLEHLSRAINETIGPRAIAEHQAAAAAETPAVVVLMPCPCPRCAAKQSGAN